MKSLFTGLSVFALLLFGSVSAFGGAQLRSDAPEDAPNNAPDNATDNVRDRILILPFEQLDPDPQHAWITQAMTRSLATEFARERALRPVTLPSENVRNIDLQDEQAVLTLARDNDARYILTGSYQVVEPNIRLTGHLIDVQFGNPIGAIKATGLVQDLFSLQDTIADQARRQLPDVALAERPAEDPLMLEHPTPPPAIEPVGPVRLADERRGYFEGSGLEHAIRYGTSPHHDRYYDRYTYEQPVYPPYPPVYGYYPYPYYHPPVVIPIRVRPVALPTKWISPPPPKPAPSIQRHTMTRGMRHTADRDQFHR